MKIRQINFRMSEKMYKQIQEYFELIDKKNNMDKE